MQFNCDKCSCQFEINISGKITSGTVSCPQCNNLIPVNSEHLGKIHSPDKTTKFKSIKITSEYGELSLPKNIKLTFTVEESREEQSRFEITKPKIMVGRKIGDLLIDDPAISPQHALLEVFSDNYLLTDLGSKKGTFVNNKKIEQQLLKSTDEIRIGKTKLFFLATAFDFLEEVMVDQADNDETDEIVDSNGQDDLKIDEKPEPDVNREELIDKHEVNDVPDMFRTLRAKQSMIEEMAPKGTKSPLEIKLSIKYGPQTAKSYRSRMRNLVLGRGDQADIIIEDAEVSRKHTLIEVVGQNLVYVSDLSSANGTYLNGDKISRTKILNNDVIKIGNTYIEIGIKIL